MCCVNLRYVRCEGMAKQSVDAVRNGELRILPQMHEQTWYAASSSLANWPMATYASPYISRFTYLVICL